MSALFQQFSSSSKSLLVDAQETAEKLDRSVGTDLVVVCMLRQPETLPFNLLQSLGIESDEGLIEDLSSIKKESAQKEMRTLLEESVKLASNFHFSTVEPEHLLYVIARMGRFSGYKLLKKQKIDPEAVANHIAEWLYGMSMLRQGLEPEPAMAGGATARNSEQKVSFLEKFTVNLTQAAKQHALDPVIGREQEIEDLIHILLRRNKNNPLLLGEPGVGKTALVDGLAQRIAARSIPKALVGKQVLMLDLSLVVAGTMYRGQFEERLKSIIDEVKKNGNYILFVDEIHTLTGTGSSEGGFDAANILKPALARGEITLIGATTHEEYRTHIRKDKALDRRFQIVQVEEPSTEETITILKNLAPLLETHHNVLITPEAIQAAAELSQRYIHDRFLPDKALDVLDEAAGLHAENITTESPDEVLQEQIGQVSEEKAEAALNNDWIKARELMQEENSLLRKLDRLQNKKKRTPKPTKAITTRQISTIIATRTGIPLQDIEETLQPLDISKIKKALNQRILGQEEPIDAITKTIARNTYGLKHPKKPIGSFLLVGPTGVGKTETARALAEEIFNDSKALIKIDMSEYSERHTISNLIGAPAGYVGFEQGGSLTEQVRKRPYAVVLFDEVEKADPEVFNLLLQILEDGELTDNTGNHTSFAHTFILMTSNIGMESFNQVAKIGFSTEEEDDSPKQQKQKQEELKDTIQKEIDDFFRPELLGRLSGTLFYAPLDKKVITRLIKQRLDNLKNHLKSRGIQLSHTAGATKWMMEQYDPAAGARSIDRLFLRTIEPTVIEELLKKPELKKCALTVEKNELLLK